MLIHHKTSNKLNMTCLPTT